MHMDMKLNDKMEVSCDVYQCTIFNSKLALLLKIVN